MLFKTPNARQLYVQLLDIEPVIWRRLVAPIDWDLGRLHLVLQAAFNWWDYHLHTFEIGGLSYGDPEAGNELAGELDARVFDQAEVRLADFSRDDGVRFVYTYDFGDNWRHRVELEDLVAEDVAPKSARCVGGARARPPEDVGGVGGYEQFLEVIGDPDHTEHRETKRWCGGHFDPEWFDIALTDKWVRNAHRASSRRPLHQPKARRDDGASG